MTKRCRRAASGKCHCQLPVPYIRQDHLRLAVVPNAELDYLSLAVAPDAEKRYFLVRWVWHAGYSPYHSGKMHDDDASQKMGHDGVPSLPSHSQK